MTGLLIFIGLILVILNVLSIKKQNKSFNGVLGNAIDNIDDYDIKIGELRREFSESILELQSQIMDMKEVIEKHNSSNRNYNFEKIEKNSLLTSEVENQKQIEENENKIIIDETATSTNNSNSEKVEEIKKLFTEGLSAEEISQKLHLGKGEVLLIKDLYIR